MVDLYVVICKDFKLYWEVKIVGYRVIYLVGLCFFIKENKL